MLKNLVLDDLKREIRERNLPVAIHLWDGTRADPCGNARLRITIRSPRALESFLNPTLGGIARHYVNGELDLFGELPELLHAGERLCGKVRSRARSLAEHLRNAIQHTRGSDRRNVRRHYDINDDFFGLWLDSQRTYSCAYFASADDSLEKAQEQKLDLICRKLTLKPGERLLDMGCGWGGLLFWAAERYGVLATGITLSRNQHAYVLSEIRRRGLQGKVEVLLMDYRDLEQEGRFDKIASVGMMEHIGHANLTQYFAVIQRLLRPGGLLLNHAVASASVTAGGLGSGIAEFVHEFVFPGGELVHVSRTLQSMTAQGLECLDFENLRSHSTRTLWNWVERLDRNGEAARRLVGERSFRTWRIFMAGSAHAFARNWLGLYQVVAGKPREDGSLPYAFTREHLSGAYPTGARS